MYKKKFSFYLVFCAFFAFNFQAVFALEPGTASGQAVINGKESKLTFASMSEGEDPFDSSKKNIYLLLSDKVLSDVSPDDDIELSMKARRGECVALRLRLEGGKLSTVSWFYPGLAGKVQLPGSWFDFTYPQIGNGSLKLISREFDGQTYSASVNFSATAYSPPAMTEESESPDIEEVENSQPVSSPSLAPASTSLIQPKAATSLLVQAIMAKNEHQALELIKLGADPNGRDQWGMPVLNWAVLMCQPKVVQALVNAKADLKYERTPGMTITQEAGACPEAAKILHAAGAK